MKMIKFSWVFLLLVYFFLLVEQNWWGFRNILNQCKPFPIVAGSCLQMWGTAAVLMKQLLVENR